MIRQNLFAGQLALQTGTDIFASPVVYTGLLFCGAMGLFSFFILLVYLKTRERIYLYYCLFLIFSLAAGIIDLGKRATFDFHSWKTEGLALGNLELVTLLAFSAYGLFTIELFDIKKKNRKLHSWILVMAFISALYGLIYYFVRPLIVDWILIFFIVSRTVIMLMSIISIFWVIAAIRSPVKIYFIIGSVWYFMGALLAILRDTTTHLPIAPFYRLHATVYFQAGIFLETICFALALIYRMHLHYEQRQQDLQQLNTQAIYEKEMAQAEALALRIQINPHFLFNCLNLINYYIQSNQNKKATHYLITFSQFIRRILDLDQKPVISLKEELKIISNYLTLEEARYDQSFSYHLEIHPSVDIEKTMIPPMLLQPFVEEALWNGPLSNGQYDRELTVNIRKDGPILNITIQDDGINERQNDRGDSKKFHKALSSQLTTERIALFNKNYDEKIAYEIQEEKNDIHYTRTVITIKYKQ